VKTFLQLYGADLDAALGSGDRTELFTAAKRKQAINDAQEWFAQETGCVERVETITLADNDQELNLSTEIADNDFLRLSSRGPYIQVTDTGGHVTTIGGREFVRTTVEELDADSPGWRNTDPATPAQWYERPTGAAHYFGLVPAINIPSGSAALYVPYAARPVDMSDDADVPFRITGGSTAQARLAPWVDALVKKAAALLEPLRKNYEAAQQRETEAVARVLAYKDAQRVVGSRHVRLGTNYRVRRNTAPRTVRESA
jgi:hypothetical protein